MKSAHDLVAAAKQRITEIEMSKADAAIRDANILLDVREPDEYAAGHIPGAINIPRGMLEFRMSAAPELTARDLQIMLYCKSGGRAALAAATLLDMGYLKVESLAGGFDSWAAAGHPVARPQLPDFE